MPLLEDIARYSSLFGPSGHEDQVIRTFAKDLASLGISAKVDKLGNVIAPVCDAQPSYPRIMISAHLDEVGFVIRKIEADGFLRVYRIGGINDRVIAGQILTFETDHGLIEGVVGVKAKHVSKPEELHASIPVEDAYIDIMAPSAADAHALGLEVGSAGTYKATFLERNNYLRGKALDDRVGIAMLLELSRRIKAEHPQSGVIIVATVQEEFSVRGGIPAAREVHPDIALCLDIAIATDTPDLQSVGSLALGAGPVITRFTRANLNGIIPNPKLWRFARDVAQQQGIPVQYGVLQGGLTDASYMQYEGAGIPALDVSFATRYTHTAVETCHIKDIEQTVDLVEAMLHATPENFDLSRG